MSIRLSAVALCVVLLGTACGFGVPFSNAVGSDNNGTPQIGDPMREQLAFARDLWAQAEFDMYTLNYARVCSCDDLDRTLFEVQVVDGRVDVVDPEGHTHDGSTVEHMFDEIENALDADPYHVQAQYDSETGRPLEFTLGTTSDAVGADKIELLPDGATDPVPSEPLPMKTALSSDFCDTYSLSAELTWRAANEATVAESIEATHKLADLAPPELADGVAAYASMIMRVDELAAAQNYDPEFFESDPFLDVSEEAERGTQLDFQDLLLAMFLGCEAETGAEVLAED